MWALLPGDGSVVQSLTHQASQTGFSEEWELPCWTLTPHVLEATVHGPLK